MNTLEEKVREAVNGDKKALEEVVYHIQDLIYNLAIRMLWHPDDAKDATQDILIKIITNLGTFKHKSAFTTWVYRISTNSLINFKKKKFTKTINFEDYEKQLNNGLSNTINYTSNTAEQNFLIQEAKIGCSNAMLQCLSKESRATYIIGEILEFNSNEAAIILDITPESFRKRLSRSRKRLHNFLNKNCGIVNPENKCRCSKKVDNAIRNKIIQPTNLIFTNNIKNTSLIDTIEHLNNQVSLYHSNPIYKTPEKLFSEIKKIITAID